MTQTTQIVWRGLEPSAALAERIQHHVDALEQTWPRATSCRVIISVPHRSHRHGRHYEVKLSLGVRGGPVVVTRDPAGGRNAEDAYAAVNEAFAKLTRRLERAVTPSERAIHRARRAS